MTVLGHLTKDIFLIAKSNYICYLLSYYIYYIIITCKLYYNFQAPKLIIGA